MNSLSLSMLSAVQAREPGLAETEDRAIASASRQPVSAELLRIANRVALSLHPGEVVVAITGVSEKDPGEAFAKGLAYALLRLGKRSVLYVDATGGPSHADGVKATGSPQAHWLDSEEIIQKGDLSSPDVAVPDELTLGDAAGSDLAVVSAEKMAALQAIFRSYEIVVLHVGSVMTAEGMVMASRADAVVAVASVGESTKRQVSAVRAELSLIKARFLGLVLAGRS